MRLCFATNNEHKLAEVQQLFGNKFNIIGLAQIGHQGNIPEDYDTMEQNSMQKARFIKSQYGIDCFADDSGLEVKALNWAPGVYSARYAGIQRSSVDNNARLMQEMLGKTDRAARFKAVISLALGDSEHQFTGIVDGQIIKEMMGTDGFGYDPLFIPNGYSQTFAEMKGEEKNKISHRGLAITKLINHLQGLKKEINGI